MLKESSKNLCLFHAVDGLRIGLSNFSHPSRVALVYAMDAGDELRIYDPQDLLRGHEPKLQELYIDCNRWRDVEPQFKLKHKFDLVHFENLDLTGLISYGGRSRDLFYQMWFTEHHPDMCSSGPTERWLEHAARLLAQDFALDAEINIGTSGYVLQGCALHAVRDHIVDERNLTLGPDTRLRIYPTLEAVLGISKTKEEGACSRGQLAFVESRFLQQMEMLVEFPALNRPEIKNYKHVSKLLQSVANSERRLVSDGKHILGISRDSLPPASLCAEFDLGDGYLRLEGETVCSFHDGNFSSNTGRAKLVQLEEAFLEAALDDRTRTELFKAVSGIVHYAQKNRFGCTLVVDLNPEPVSIAGQDLEEPLDLKSPNAPRLIDSLARVDGALHLGRDLKLHGFACLLDGRRVSGEDRSRGARFNSALRFTAENEDIIVVVVSRDRPVSIIQNGVELTGSCEWTPVSHCMIPPLLRDWIKYT